MTRERLPDRRPNMTVKIEHNNMTHLVTMGFNPEDACVLEVFGNAKKASTDMDYLIADSCVVISMALQFGATASTLLHSLHWDVQSHERVPASIIGKILAAIILTEAQLRDPN